MMLIMQNCGIDVECHHHEVAFRRTDRDRPEIRLAGALCRQDAALQIHREERRQPAGQDGDVHAQADLWRQRQAACTRTSRSGKLANPLFAGDGYAGLSQLALWYVGGLIKHGPALSAIIAPTTNSYKRLVPGFEAPVNLAYSRRNRSAACRIPMYSAAPKAKRVEFRPPDPSCNPYLAFAAMLMAGLDGIENKMDPGQPLDKDIYELDPEQLSSIPSMPGSLEDALDALQRDHAFLLKGDVFTEELIAHLRRLQALERSRRHPHSARIRTSLRCITIFEITSNRTRRIRLQTPWSPLSLRPLHANLKKYPHRGSREWDEWP